MFLLILDKDPIKSAQLVPDKLKFKQLIELCQLICSAGISDIYKSIKQGKELQYWVRNNQNYVKRYGASLFLWCKENIKMKLETEEKIFNILLDLDLTDDKKISEFAIFRYSKDYDCPLKTNTVLPIDLCANLYKDYIEWKKLKCVRGYV